ncbi:MAG: YfhO family protein [Clostridia bacterium]|nr:YfhO family protein [Clostridia bacterium]
MKKVRDFFRSHPYLAFTAVFLVMGLVIFAPYWMAGKVLISTFSDAVEQHFPALIYYGEYLRDVLKTVFLEHSLAIPAWDLSIGLGGDIITTLHYYALGDPFNLLSVFFPAAYMDLCYSLIVVLRLYCAGLAAMAFFRHWKAQPLPALLGALCYCFSGFAIAPGVFHPFFAGPMIWFPLLLLGMEYILEGKKPWLFSATVALAAVSSFYFFYMLVILAVIYAAVRFLMLRKEILLRLWRIFRSAVIGVLIAAPVLIPNIQTILQSDRLGAEHTYALFYPESYYELLPASLISDQNQFYFYVAVAAPVLVAVLALFLSEKQWWLKGSLAGLLCFAVFPAVGAAFNGFSYATNRWIWALILALCCTFALQFHRLPRLSPEKLKALTVLAAIYGGICLLPFEAKVLRTYAAVFFLFAAVGLLWLKGFRWYRPAMAVLVLGAVAFNSLAWTTDRAEDCVGQGELYAAYQRVASAGLPEDSRFDGTYDSLVYYNAAMQQDTNGTSFYFSTTTPGTDSFRSSLTLNSSMAQQYKGLDGRSYLAAALGVSHFIANEETAAPRPYGYDEQTAEDVYTGSATLPLVYAFDTVYQGDLTVEERQQTLLQCAVVEEEVELPQAEPAFTHRTVSAEIKSLVGVEQVEGGIRANIKGAAIILNTEIKAGEEAAVVIEGLRAELKGDATESCLGFYCGEIENRLNYLTSDDNYYCGYHDFWINLGIAEEDRDRIMIVFTEPGIYYFDEARIVAQPLEDFEAQVQSLADSGISGITLEKTGLSFRSDRAEAGIACAAIPWQEGWSATVDGEPAEVFSIQSGLCGILLPAGAHEVIMTYRTPYSVPAGLLCIVGLILLLWNGGVLNGLLHKLRKRV